MEPATFLARALEEGLRYGADPCVFLRELAQNARDAEASQIDVTAHDERGSESIVFADDGHGMSFEHARRYLFRLYASSKEEDRDAAGHFGVGFWSVLQWRPRRIRVEARTKAGTGWGLALDAGLRTAVEVPCSLSTAGCRVILERPCPTQRGEKSFVATVRERLREYCRYLRRAGTGNQRLAVFFNGERIDEPMTLAGPIVLRFAGRRVEGVVGLADQPRVELYARGLLVKKVAFLEELEPGGRAPRQVRPGSGLSPVVLLNSDELKLVVSRQAPVQNRALRRLVRMARRRVGRLISSVVDQACPRTPTERVLDGIRRVLTLAGGPATVAVGAIWLTAFAALVALLSPESGEHPSRAAGLRMATSAAAELVAGDRASSPTSPPPRPYKNIARYHGATVNVLRGDEPSWGLSYRGPSELFFKALTLDRYDTARGLLRGEPGTAQAYPSFDCRGRRCIRVALAVAANEGVLTLPLPTGYRVDVSTVQFQGRPLPSPLFSNVFGEPLLYLPSGTGVIRYQAGIERRTAIPAARFNELDVELPPAMRRVLDRLANLPVRKRVRQATAAVRGLIAYDVSAQTAKAYREGKGPWLTRVLTIGAGDCDVKNGLNVLALRYLGVPARMAVGLPARCDERDSPCDGRARPGLHAWTEFYMAGRWRVVDASGPARTPPLVAMSPIGGPAPVAGGVELPVVGQASPPPSVPPLRSPTDGTLVENVSSLSTAHAVELAVPQSHSPWSIMRWHNVWLALLGLLTASFVLVAWYLGRVRESLRIRGGSSVSAQALARILKDALTRPASWRASSGLLHRRVLPTVIGRPMSVAEAIARSRAGKLWVTHRRRGLAHEAAQAGTPVLNGGDPLFGDVISVLGHGIDLDAVTELRPDAKPEPIIGALAEQANRVLRQAGVAVSCAVCPGLTDAPVRDVDLSGVRLNANSEWPRRFIAIAPDHATTRRWGQALRNAPSHAAFAWIDWLLERSELLVDDAQRVREAAALEVIGRIERGA